MKKSSFAVVYTVKNEATILPEAIRYHQHLGASKIYVFFDGTTDHTREVVSKIDEVVCSETLPPNDEMLTHRWINDIYPEWTENMDVRKRINAMHALKLSLEAGVEWLAAIDPDELLHFATENDKHQLSSDTFFESIAPSVDQVLLQNLEAIPTSDSNDSPFVTCSLFTRRLPVTDIVSRYFVALLRRLHISAYAVAWCHYIFYQIRFCGSLPRLMRHPTTREFIPCGHYLGYTNFKSIIRTATAQEFNFNTHKWQNAVRQPVTVYAGRVLHYDLCNSFYLRSKFSQRSKSMMVKTFYSRYMIDRVAREVSDIELKTFFKQFFVFSDAKVVNKLIQHGAFCHIESVRRFFTTPQRDR